MLHEVFYWLFNMSIAATLIGAVVVLLRAVRKIPRRISVVLWLAPYIRMCVPFGLNHPYSLMSLLSKLTTRTVIIYRPTDDLAFSMTNIMMEANGYFPIEYKENVLESVFSAAAVVWMIVSLAILLTLGVLYFVTLRELRDAEHGEGNVYYSGKVTSPAVYGIFKPKIVFPLSCRGSDTRFALLHERTHIKRADNLLRIVAFAATAAHWFNPFIWIFLKLFLSDLEFACDERVLMGLDASEVKAYARSLIDSKEGSNVFVSAFGGAAVRTRIENILSFKRMTWFSAVGFSALAVSILVVLLTNAS